MKLDGDAIGRKKQGRCGAIIDSSLILLKSATISGSRGSSLTSFSISVSMTAVGSSPTSFRCFSETPDCDSHPKKYFSDEPSTSVESSTLELRKQAHISPRADNSLFASLACQQVPPLTRLRLLLKVVDIDSLWHMRCSGPSCNSKRASELNHYRMEAKENDSN